MKYSSDEEACKSMIRRVREFAEANPGMDQYVAAEKLINQMNRQEVLEAAWLHIADDYGHRDRMRVRKLEQEQSVSRPLPEPSNAWARRPWSHDAHKKLERASWAVEVDRRCRVARGEEESFNDNDLEACKRTLQDEVVSEQRHREITTEFHRNMQSALDAYKADAIREWTEELLNETFALGDGTRVKWGDATVDQHLQRIALLQRNITGNIETMKLHKDATKRILEARASNLRETM